MPSPVGHTLAGCCLAVAAAGRTPALGTPAFGAALIVAANLPDLDFLGLLFGFPAASVHQSATHSIAFALAAAVPLAWLPRGSVPRLQAWRWLAAAGLAHLALDFVSHDALPPIGIPLGWPFSDARWHSATELFPGSDRSRLFSERNLRELATELAWLLPPLLLLSRKLIAGLGRAVAARQATAAGAGGGHRSGRT